MNYQNLQLFGVAEIEETHNGIKFYRYPQKVIESLGVPEYDKNGNFIQNYKGHKLAANACVGMEIRFVYDGTCAQITFYCEKSATFMAFVGDYQIGYYMLSAGESTIEITRPNNSFGVKEGSCNRYSMNLWRIVPECDLPITLVRLTVNEGNYRLPKENERTTMLVYGSSISQGCGTPFATMNYLNIAANLLGWDIKNKAIAGGCFCETSVRDFLLNEAFDCAYFELGTNIANRPLQMIEERVGTFIATMATAFPQKTIYLMTPITGLSDVSITAEEYATYFANTKLVIEKYGKRYKNVVLLDGHALLDKDYYLSADILHPSAFGHVMMGINLAEMIKNSKK